jgi:hypothetical protein
MNHYTLRFPDEQAARDAADGLGHLSEDGEVVGLAYKADLHIIGEVTVPGTSDDAGNELTPPVVLPGFFVNLGIPGRLPPALVPYQVPYGSAGNVFTGTEHEVQPGTWPPTP